MTMEVEVETFKRKAVNWNLEHKNGYSAERKEKFASRCGMFEIQELFTKTYSNRKTNYAYLALCLSSWIT